jgi:uncharacterized membrane protein YfcA
MVIQIILITILTTASSAICTIAGFGTTTISLPILLFFFPIHQAILFIAIIHWFENIWRMILFRKGITYKLILQFGIPAMIASALGARISIKMPEEILIRMLGIFLLSYATFIMLKPKATLRKIIKNNIIGGAFSGLFAGIIGLGGAIRAAFLNAYNLEKISYIFSTNTISLLIDSSRLPIYMCNGTSLNTMFTCAAILFIPFSLIGTILAKRLVIRIPQQRFRILVTIFLGLAGIKFLLFS